jgi:hypothetical protein
MQSAPTIKAKPRHFALDFLPEFQVLLEKIPFIQVPLETLAKNQVEIAKKRH